MKNVPEVLLGVILVSGVCIYFISFCRRKMRKQLRNSRKISVKTEEILCETSVEKSRLKIPGYYDEPHQKKETLSPKLELSQIFL